MEKHLQVESIQLSLPPPPIESMISDTSCPPQPDAIAAHSERSLHDNYTRPPGTKVFSSTTMLENMKNDISCPAHLGPQATAATKKLHVGISQLISESHQTRRDRAGKRHRRNTKRKVYISAAQGSRGSQGRGRIPITKTAAQGSRGPQRRGRISMANTSARRRSNCRARVISKDSEDHDIGRRLDRGGRAHEFTTKRLDLGLDCSLVSKGVSPSSGEVVSAS